MSVPRARGAAGPVVLNTRPREQAAELSDLLRAAGYTPLEAPAIETVAAWKADELAGVLGRLRAGHYAWAVFSSRNAVRFFLQALEAVGGSAKDLQQVKLLAGPGTADALGANALRVTRMLARFSAEAALSSLRSELAPGQWVLVPRAAEGRDELINGLPNVDAPACYRTEAVRQGNLDAVDISAVILTSPSAAQSLVGRLPKGCAIVCLGATTAQAAQAAGLRVDRVAKRTDLSSLVEAVTAALSAAEVSA